MNRMEAILACNVLSMECDKHRECKDCPVRLENNQDYQCLIDYIVENYWDRKMFTSLANDEISKILTEEKCKNEQQSFATIESWEKATDKHKDNQTPSIPLKNVGSIIIRDRSNSAELAAALKDPSNMTLTVTESDKERDDVDPPKEIDISWLNDSVKHPYHYLRGGMECIDVIRAVTSDLSGTEAYYVGNIIKYIWRYKHKNGLEDLRKAEHYLKWLMEEVKKNETR